MRPLLLCSVLAACGFQAPNGGTPTEPPDATIATDGTDATPTLTPETFLERLLTEECEQAFACEADYPPTAHASFADAWGTDLNDCVVTDRDYLARDAVAAAVTAGRISFDPTLAAACLAAPGIPTSCTTLFANNYDWADTCYQALAGHVPDGEACTTGWECGPASHCIAATCKR